jgi:hypothetical protein
VGNISATITDPRCASAFWDRVFFDHPNDQEGYLLSPAPFTSGTYVDHRDGGRCVLVVWYNHIAETVFSYFIRSTMDRRLFWFYDEPTRQMIVSYIPKTKFTIEIVDRNVPRGSVIIGTDKVSLSVAKSRPEINWQHCTNIINAGTASIEQRSNAELLTENETEVCLEPERFSLLSGGIAISYLGNISEKRRGGLTYSSSGEKWELV